MCASLEVCMYECVRVHEMSPRTSMTYRTSCWAPYALRASVDVWGQWCLRSLDYRCAVQTCMGFDFIFIRTGTCFPSPYHLLLASVSKDAAPSDLSTHHHHHHLHQLLLLPAPCQSNGGGKKLLQAYVANEQVSKILQDTHVAAVAKGHQCQEQFALRASRLVPSTSGVLGFTFITAVTLFDRAAKKNAISCSFLRLFQNVEVFYATHKILSQTERELLEDIELSPRNTGSGFHVCPFGDLCCSALARCGAKYPHTQLTHATLLQLKVSVLSALI